MRSPKGICMRLVPILFALLAGCSSQAVWVYTPGKAIVSPSRTLPVRLAVLPLQEWREEGNTNASWVGLIPLVPFGRTDFNRPEGGGGFLAHSAYNSRPSEDYSKAIAREIAQTGMVTEVFYTERDNEPGVDYTLTGKIKNNRYSGHLYTYCLSFYGSLFWLFGAPAGSASNELELSLELRRPGGGPPVWTSSTRGECGRVIGLYYNFGAEFEGYPRLLREGLEKALPELAEALEADAAMKVAAGAPGGI